MRVTEINKLPQAEPQLAGRKQVRKPTGYTELHSRVTGEVCQKATR